MELTFGRAQAILLASLLVGGTGVITQVVITRELLTNFHGNELTVGIVMAVWLLLEASGALFARRVAGRTSQYCWFFWSLVASFALLPLSLWFSRVIRLWLGMPQWQAFSLFGMLRATMIVALPVSVIHGALFTLACEAYSSARDDSGNAPGAIYIWETCGTLVGALLYTFLLAANPNSFEIILGAMFIGLAASALVALKCIPSGMGRRVAQVVSLTLVASGCLAWWFGVPQRLHELSLRHKWHGQEVVGYHNSRYGNMTVIRTGTQLSLYYDGSVALTVPAPDTESVEQAAHLPLLFHPEPKHVLVVSGGLGGVLGEVQKHGPSLIRYVEMDPEFTSVASALGSELIGRELSDPRLELSHLDGRLYVMTSKHKYDVIIMGLPEPGTLQVNRLYTEEFFRGVSTILRPGGVICVSLPGSDSYLGREVLDLNRCIYATLRRVFPYVRILPGDRNFLLGSASRGVLDVSTDLVIERFRERQIEASLMSDWYLTYRLDETRGRHFTAAISHDTGVRINTDLNPAGLFYALSYLGAMYTPGVQQTLRSAWSTDPRWLILLALMSPALVMLSNSQRAISTGAVSYSVFTTGLAGMTLDLILILGFQCLYGYVYHMIGLLVACFMSGATIGGIWALHSARHIDARRLLMTVEASLIALSLLFVALTRVQPAGHQALSPVYFFMASAVSGCLTGAAFPTASRLVSPRLGAAGAAGLLYSLDLSGGFLGGLLCSVVLVPAMGIGLTCLVIAAIKGGSLLMLLCPAILHKNTQGYQP